MISKHFSNIAGWQSKKKIVVFESDDWGCIRMPDFSVQKELIANGVRVDRNYFSLNDTLESEIDLNLLSNELGLHKDVNGNPPVFTTLHIMCNPDFSKIKEFDFNQYFGEFFFNTYSRYNRDSSKMRDLWSSGYNNKIFFPGFHGREHLHADRWIGGLRNRLPVTFLAFKLGMFGIHSEIANEYRKDYFASYDIDSLEQIPNVKHAIQEGLLAFNDYFGFKTRYFVPPNGLFPIQVSDILGSFGIRFFNTPKIAKVPMGDGTYSVRLRWLGKKLSHNLICVTRNAFFEPSNSTMSIDWVDRCLHDISIAFRWNKPAIVSTHRVNYVGGIFPSNRDRGLKQLNILLKRMLQRWPDIEFMHSERLGDSIINYTNGSI